MNKTLARVIAVSGIAGLAILGLTACSNPAPEPSSSSSEEVGGNVVAPIMIDPATADGQTFDIPMNSSGYIQAPAGQESGWTATFSQEGVVSFTDGGTESDATFNPGLQPVAPGMTDVTLTDPAGASITFMVNVTE